MATYDVSWSVSIEIDVNDEVILSEQIGILEAVRQAYEMIVDTPNHWLWEVKNQQTGKTYDVDYWTDGNETAKITEKIIKIDKL